MMFTKPEPIECVVDGEPAPVLAQLGKAGREGEGSGSLLFTLDVDGGTSVEIPITVIHRLLRQHEDLVVGTRRCSLGHTLERVGDMTWHTSGAERAMCSDRQNHD